MKIVLMLLLAFAFAGQVVAGTSPYAEVVIINGQVITADSDDPSQVTIAEAVAIQGDKILAVGTNAEIRHWSQTGQKSSTPREYCDPRVYRYPQSHL